MIDYALRPATAADNAFLAALFASTREEEMAHSGWPEEFKAAFCAQQFAAQTAHYRAHYADASFSVIEHGGAPVGRLIVLRSPRSLHIVDISLLPTARGQGIGSRLLGDLLTEARAEGKTVCLCVEKMNRARQLYGRLGFRDVADEGISWRMEWRDTRPATLSSQDSPRTSSLKATDDPFTDLRQRSAVALSL